jgi:hypothetical protein
VKRGVGRGGRAGVLSIVRRVPRAFVIRRSPRRPSLGDECGQGEASGRKFRALGEPKVVERRGRCRACVLEHSLLCRTADLSELKQQSPPDVRIKQFAAACLFDCKSGKQIYIIPN